MMKTVVDNICGANSVVDVGVLHLLGAGCDSVFIVLHGQGDEIG